ncbi:hypothetical protein [Streptosporangium roseum]|uniref:hypothetical protein n=1 Tax=Streptosporangium roseum TaxID=2001 RepID=UPI000A8AF177|nr:hypothetical protein [Streptosporangium roseum]
MSETDSTDDRPADDAPEAVAGQEGRVSPAAPPDVAAAELPDDTPEGFEPL